MPSAAAAASARTATYTPATLSARTRDRHSGSRRDPEPSTAACGVRRTGASHTAFCPAEARVPVTAGTRTHSRPGSSTVVVPWIPAEGRCHPVTWKSIAVAVEAASVTTPMPSQSSSIANHRRHTVTGRGTRRVAASSAEDGIHARNSGATTAPMRAPVVLAMRSSTSASR
ncbi:Uncharacterised protein [Rothia kristinae]|nr:Uncharacterised protein [Rothia kristinae]